MPNPRAGIPGQNVTIAKRCAPLPVEAVVRGYLTGVTDTAAWTRYSAGQRDFGGTVLPERMHKNQRLPQPLFDPTTKEASFDRTLTPEQMIAEGFITSEMFDRVKTTALALFSRGQGTGCTQWSFCWSIPNTNSAPTKQTDSVLIDEIHARTLSDIGISTLTQRASQKKGKNPNISTRNSCGCGSKNIATHTGMRPCRQRHAGPRPKNSRGVTSRDV